MRDAEERRHTQERGRVSSFPWQRSQAAAKPINEDPISLRGIATGTPPFSQKVLQKTWLSSHPIYSSTNAVMASVLGAHRVGAAFAVKHSSIGANKPSLLDNSHLKHFAETIKVSK